MKIAEDELDAYFAAARSWDDDERQALRRSRQIAWTIAAAASGLCALAMIGLASLAPLKRVEPFVVRVDESTGAVEVMTALKDTKRLTYDEAVTKHFLAQYVRAREGWFAPTAEADFTQVAIMSSPTEQRRWADRMDGANPLSPQITLGRDGSAEVDIRAISFIAEGVAAVRFRRTVRKSGVVTADDGIATIAFAYSRAPMAEADRLRNPLGFQVTSYRSDPEATP